MPALRYSCLEILTRCNIQLLMDVLRLAENPFCLLDLTSQPDRAAQQRQWMKKVLRCTRRI